MADGPSSDVKLEIGHVLFIDIVGYFKLLIEQLIAAKDATVVPLPASV